MTAPSAPAATLLDALEQRRREGRPVAVGLVGSGQMGTDILVQVAQMPGIEVVAVADAVPEVVVKACEVAGNGPRAPSFAPDVTLFVPDWQTPTVKKFAAGTYSFVGNFISDSALSPNSVGFGLDGNLIVLSDSVGATASVRRYDAATGAFLGVLVPAGTAGLGRASRMLVLPAN